MALPFSCCYCGNGLTQRTVVDVDATGRVACCAKHKDLLLKGDGKKKGWYCNGHR